MKNVNTLVSEAESRLTAKEHDISKRKREHVRRGNRQFKGLFFAIIMSSFLFSGTLRAQTVCDSLQIDSVQVQGNMLSIYFSNASQHGIVYPILIVTLNPNPHLTVSSNAAISSYLDIAGGANNGVTQFLPTLTQTTPANLVPLNTVFTGTASMYDPNDSSFFCAFQFSFTYGTLTGNAIEEEGALLTGMNVYPNPVSDNVNVNLSGLNDQHANVTITNALGEVVFSESAEVERDKPFSKTINTETFAPGVYFLSIDASGNHAVARFIKE